MRVSLALTPPPLLCPVPRSDTLAFDTHGDAFEHLSERLMRARPARKLAAAALSSNGTVPMLSVQARRQKSRGLSLLLRSALRSPGSVQAAKVGHEGAGVDVAAGAGLPSAQADAESGRDADDAEGGASDDDDDDDEWSSEEEEEEEEVAEASSLSIVGTEAQCALIAKMAGVNSVQFTRFIEGNSVKSEIVWTAENVAKNATGSGSCPDDERLLRFFRGGYGGTRPCKCDPMQRTINCLARKEE